VKNKKFKSKNRRQKGAILCEEGMTPLLCHCKNENIEKCSLAKDVVPMLSEDIAPMLQENIPSTPSIDWLAIVVTVVMEGTNLVTRENVAHEGEKFLREIYFTPILHVLRRIMAILRFEEWGLCKPQRANVKAPRSHSLKIENDGVKKV